MTITKRKFSHQGEDSYITVIGENSRQGHKQSHYKYCKGLKENMKKMKEEMWNSSKE